MLQHGLSPGGRRSPTGSPSGSPSTASGGQGTQELQKSLGQSIERIVNLRGRVDEAHINAFNGFMRGVTHASSGQLNTPEQLLSALEPKGPVLHFLVELYSAKRIHRRRIAACLTVLLPVRSWLEALRSDRELCKGLPEDLSDILSENANTVEAVEAPGVHVLPYSGQVQESKATILLQEAVSEIEALDFSAVDGDAAVCSFEKFRRAVTWIVQSTSKGSACLLDSLEPKARLLEFLVDVYDRRKKYRARVASALTRLLDFKSWRDIAVSDGSLHAAVRDLMVDERRQTRRDTFLSAATVNDRVNLDAATTAAISEGGHGLLYVRIVGAYNLCTSWQDATSMSPFVRVRLGNRAKRTDIAVGADDPVWDAAPFLFTVPTPDAAVIFEVLDSDITSDVSLGSLQVPVADALLEVHPPSKFKWSSEMWPATRYRLAGAASGELEVVMVFCITKEASSIREGASSSGPATTTAREVDALPLEAAQNSSSSTGSIRVLRHKKANAKVSWQCARLFRWFIGVAAVCSALAFRRLRGGQVATRRTYLRANGLNSWGK